MDYIDVCFEIENDEFFRQFLFHPDRSAKVQSAGGTLSVSEKIEKLSKGIDKLNSELEAQVLSKHHDLLTQASRASSLEVAVCSMREDASGLLGAVGNLRAQVLAPHAALRTQITALSRLTRTCHLTRHAMQIIQLTKQLKNLVKEPAQQADVLYQVEQLLSDEDFSGIDLLKEDILVVASTKDKLIKDALQKLQQGLSSGEETVLLSCFKVLNNLHCAKEKVSEIVERVLKDVTLAIQNAFNVQVKPDATRSGPGKSSVVSIQIFKQQLWENVEKLFTRDLYSACQKIILLQAVLDNLQTMDKYRNVSKDFWDKLSMAFSTELKKSSSATKQSVEVDFPKLLKCYNELCNKAHYKDFTVQRETLSIWENTFVSKSLERLLEPVRSMWLSGSGPSTEQVDAAVRVISAALSVSLGDKQLSLALASSVAKCIKQMTTEAEQRVWVDNDAGQIIEAPSGSQLKNADLSNILFYFSTQITRVLNNMSAALPSESVAIIQNSLKEMSNIPILQPFSLSINSAVDLIIGSMHSEPDLNKDSQETIISSSAYLRELQQFISRCREIYLSLYQDVAAVSKCCEGIATHSIQVFVENVCYVRPVTDYGRRKLQADCKQLEVALLPLVSEISFLECHRELRALHTLLGLKPVQILDSQSKGASLSYSLVMMLLFSFGSPDLMSPHVCAGWTGGQLSRWLLEHRGERERLEFIAGGLQRYQAHIRQNNISKYDDVYPILLQLLEDGRKHCQTK